MAGFTGKEIAAAMQKWQKHSGVLDPNAAAIAAAIDLAAHKQEEMCEALCKALARLERH